MKKTPVKFSNRSRMIEMEKQAVRTQTDKVDEQRYLYYAGVVGRVNTIKKMK